MSAFTGVDGPAQDVVSYEKVERDASFTVERDASFTVERDASFTVERDASFTVVRGAARAEARGSLGAGCGHGDEAFTEFGR